MKIQNRTPTLPNYITASSNVWGPEKYGRFLLLVFNVYLAMLRKSVTFRIYLGFLRNQKTDWEPSV